MTVWTAPEATRVWPANVSDERTAVVGWLNFHRQTLLEKCAGLNAEQLKIASVEPSTMTLLGLVRHMSYVERWWFRREFANDKALGDLYCTKEFPDGDFDLIADADAQADFATFHAEVAAADTVASGQSLDATFVNHRGKTMDLRWVYLHMIEEYARHNGHADFLRERIDGATGA